MGPAIIVSVISQRSSLVPVILHSDLRFQPVNYHTFIAGQQDVTVAIYPFSRIDKIEVFLQLRKALLNGNNLIDKVNKLLAIL